jgi:hypothetical protein
MKGKPRPEKAAPPPRAASRGEIDRAIDALSDADNERLEQYAINRIHRIGRAAAGRSHGDLLHEAMISLMEGPRHWYPDNGVTFTVCLMGVLRSLSSAWAGHRNRNPGAPRYAGLDSELSVRNDEGRLISPFEVIRNRSLNSEEAAINAESEAKAIVDAIMADFTDDEPATLVLLCMDDEMDGPAIRSALNMTEPQFRTVTRRIQRRAKKIMEAYYAR